MTRAEFLRDYYKRNPEEYDWLQAYEKVALEKGDMQFVNYVIKDKELNEQFNKALQEERAKKGEN